MCRHVLVVGTVIDARRMRMRVIVVCLCVSVCVCSQSASCVGHFYSKLNMTIKRFATYRFV